MTRHIRLVLSAMAFATLASAAFADSPSQLAPARSFDVSSNKGKSFFTFLSMKGGLKEALDQDGRAQFKVAGGDQIHSAKDRVHPKVYGRFASAVKGGDAAVGQIAVKYTGTTTTLTIPDDIFKTGLILPQGKYDTGPFLSLASGAGVAVRIDAESIFYNVGYGDGTHDKDEMTGRSFGHGPNHKALDASDAFYLGELSDYLSSHPDASAFYRALFKVLTNCDASAFAALDGAGKTVATDFLAVYTAEADRHLMSKLQQHPWENDLAEVTIISSLSVATGKIMQSGKLVDSKIVNWWAKSKTSNRSGIGETRQDRRALQALAVNYERQHHPELVKAVESIAGKRPNGDVFEAVMEYLNNYKTPASLGANADALTEGVVKLIAQIHTDAKDIAAGSGAPHPSAAHDSASSAPGTRKPTKRQPAATH
jgi:hypothetical protein